MTKLNVISRYRSLLLTISNLPQWSSFKLFLLLLISNFVFLATACSNKALATTDPQSELPIVSATMPDVVAPSTPILISPSNNSLINDNTPEFVWSASTDNVGVSYYQLYLGGSLYFNNIPTSNTDNSQYTLTLDPSTGYYHLIPKISLSEGSHTWKIAVYDASANHAESVTWTFTIDSQAPTFVITQIGELNTSISAQDLNTIPTDPIELTANEPLLGGTGEANSSVTLTIQIPGEADSTVSFNINSSGNWQYQMGILPRDKIITLNFAIRDAAGNLTVLNDLKIIIPTAVIIIPPQPSATPTSAVSISPTPLPPGITAIPTPSLIPTQGPQISIPVVPPKEILYEIGQQIPILNQLAKILPEPVKKALEDAAPVANIIVVSSVPIISSVAVASQFGGQLSFNLITKILQALGLVPPGKPQGLVFDSTNNKSVSFAVVNVYSVGEKQIQAVNEVIITNDHGIYQGLKLPPGKYQLSVRHNDYLFPTQKKRPFHLGFKDFYQGEVFTIESDRQPEFLLVPVDPISRSEHIHSNKTRLRLALTRLARLTNTFIIPLFIFSLIMAIFYSTVWNWLVVGVYIIILLTRIRKRLAKPDVSGQVLGFSEDIKLSDEENPDSLPTVPLANAIVKLIKIDTNEVVSICFTDQKGRFAFYDQKDQYQLIVYKGGYLQTQAGEVIQLNVIDSRYKAANKLKIMMKLIEV